MTLYKYNFRIISFISFFTTGLLLPALISGSTNVNLSFDSVIFSSLLVPTFSPNPLTYNNKSNNCFSVVFKEFIVSFVGFVLFI